MSLETAAKVLSKYRNSREQQIAWYSWGEPLLYKQFVELSKMVRGTRSVISSNFSLNIPDTYFEGLQNFETVYISLSGLNADVYNIYHQGGIFDLVMRNIKKLSSYKCRRVVIRWLEHKYNKFQHEQARQFAESFGFRFEPTHLTCEVEELIEGFDHDLLRVPKFKETSDNAYCKQLRWTPIDVDGNYLLCCSSHNVKIGYTIDNEVSSRELRKAKLRTEICHTCNKRELWKMF
jgi:MoaA/NifB/PqqE/SkfB family radical SAM enzyme